MTRKEGHGNGHRGSSPEGCWKLTGDNIPGQCAVMTPRQVCGVQLRQFKVLKVIKGIIPKSTMDLGWAMVAVRTDLRKRFSEGAGGRCPSFFPFHLCALCASVAKTWPIN